MRYLIAILSAAFAATAVRADLDPTQLKQLRESAAMTPASIDAIEAATTPEALREQIAGILALDSLSVGSRDREQIDPDTGYSPIHRYLFQRIEAAPGVETIGVMHDASAFPVSLHNLMSQEAGPEASVAVGGERFAVSPLWPNGVMPSLTPADGLRGPLVDVGAGEWDDLEGKDLEAAICLMDFAGGRSWVRLMELGAVAVIVCEDAYLSRDRGERLFSATPVPFPRFYAPADTADRLRGMAGEGAEAHLIGGQVFEKRPLRSVFAYLPPTEALSYTVAIDDVLARVALQYKTTVQEIRQRNPDLPAGPDAVIGAVALKLPGQGDKPVKLREDELFRRLAEQFGVQRSELLRANPELLAEVAAAAELAEPAVLKATDRGDDLPIALVPGRVLTIPNVDQSIVIQVPLDSVSVAPDAAHGYKTATNIAAALTLMDLLAAEPTVRRRGIVFAFLDGETQGGLASRTIAGQVLNFGGEEAAGFSPTFLVVVLLLIVALGCTITWFLSARGEDEASGRRARRRKMVLIALGPYLLLGGLAGTLPQVFAAATGKSKVAEQVSSSWYDQAIAAWDAPGSAELTGDAGEWFVDEWLFSRIEAARNEVFERRVELQMLARSMPTETAEQREAKARLEARVEEMRPKSGQLGELRTQTVEQMSKPLAQRVALLRERLETERDKWSPYGLTVEELARRLRNEREEERRFEAIAEANVAVIDALQAKLHPLGTDAAAGQPVLGIYLDVSDGSASLGIRNGSTTGRKFRANAPIGGDFVNRLAKHWRQVLDAAEQQAGWDEAWTLLTADDQAVHPLVYTQSPAYGEFWVPAGVGVVAVGTINDALDKIDTPADVLDEQARMDNVATQVRTLATLFRLMAERPGDAAPPSKLKPQPFGRLVGQIVRFNARSGVNAKEPVPGTAVYYPAQRKSANDGGPNPVAYYGTRRSIVRIARLSGAYAFPVEHERFSTKESKRSVYAYHLDPGSGLFDFVVNEATLGTQKTKPEFQLADGMLTEKNMIMTRAYPRVFFPGPDPVDYKATGAPGDTVEIIDAVLDGEPQQFAYDNPLEKFAEAEMAANVVYTREGRRFRVRVRQGSAYKLLLVGDITDEEPKGAGYRVGPVYDLEGNVTDRNLIIRRTDAEIARSMLSAAQRLNDVMRDKGVRDQSVMAALENAAAHLDDADQMASQRQWRASLGEARQTWGTMVKYYPRLLKLGREAVFSAVFLMVMLLPASFFLERLLVGRKGVLARLAGTAIIFGLLTTYLNFVHPAFRISVSPFIVMVAFAMILMSSVVLLICYQRFDVLVKRAKAGAGEVEGESISLASSLGTAMSLGVSNLRKRPSRTFLTALTVTVLTFSIITFVSVQGEDAFMTRTLDLDREAGHKTVEPLEPAYRGVVFRNFFHTGLDTTFIEALRSEFGGTFNLAVRGWYLQTEGGNNVDIEGTNQERVRLEDGRFDEVTGVMTFEPAERELSQLHTAVSNQQWFTEDDRDVIIIPDNVAKTLGITPADLYTGTDEQVADGGGALRPKDELPRVFVRNRWWSVVGILDTERADRIRDVTGKSLAMVDYLKSGITSNAAGDDMDLLDEPRGYHMTWRELVIVPHQARVDVGATPRSVAVGFADDQQEADFYGRVLLRLNKPIFGSRTTVVEGNADAAEPSDEPVAAVATTSYQLLSTQSATSLAGLAKIIVPVILCVLIVLNTMLGNVEERKGEVNMLGAVGLSPGQISFLLLSESAVFSVLGIVIGLMIGLGFGFVVNLLNPTNDPAGFMGGLSLNFASLTSVGLALLSGIVVLVATLIPAKKASRLAAPSGMGRWALPEADADGAIRFTLPFTLTRGNAIGMTAFFHQFLTNHTDPASEAFNCRDIAVGVHTEPTDRIAITTRMWLAPYDLDVAQSMDLGIVPTDDSRVFGVAITLVRSSGSEEAWMRTNYRFMDLVRRQFLLWRNLKPEQRQQYIDRGKTMIEQAMEEQP